MGRQEFTTQPLPGRPAAMAGPTPARPGMLRLRDLDLPPPDALPPPPPPPDPAVLEAARQEGFRDGHAEGHRAGMEEAGHGLQARIAAALERVADAMAGSAEAGRAVAEESAQALAALMAAMLDAALPAAAPRLAPAMVARCAASLRPALQDRPGLRLHVAPELREAVAALLPDPLWDLATDPAMAAGDARFEWHGGAAVLDLAARRAAVRGALLELGLLQEETVA